MDVVKSFNAELSSLYDVKPPISKAKMTALTRGAIKAIKFYKHVVQSVEKFILKCKSEYKVPGLYVIDSIVRQSRHQFGSEKDVFAPRFAKNMQQTFVNLFRCPPEDKSKVIRVLNLWQKNQVFAPEVIQPLFDLADPNHPLHREQATLVANGSPANVQKTPTKASLKQVEGGLWSNTPQQQDANALAHLGVASLAANSSALLQLSGQTLEPNMLAQLQTLQLLLLRQAGESSGAKQDGGPVHFDRKLLDFDYGSDEEEDPANPSPKAPVQQPSTGLESFGSLLANPEVVRQLQTLQQQLNQQQQIEMEEKMRKLQEMKQQEDEFDKHLAQTVPNLPFASECDLKPVAHTNSPANLYKHEPAYVLPNVFDLSQPPPGYKPSMGYEQQMGSHDDSMKSDVEFIDHQDNGEIEVINLEHTDSRSQSSHDDRYGRRRRSRSRDRSRDRDHDRRSRRSRSRSRRRRSRSREREREREKEREKDREKDRERRKRGLPLVKKDNLSVCTTTLWVGHLSKLVHQEDLSDTFGEFGDIVSIDLIPPRGCAFIVMNRRQDAARCLSKLKNHKMQGKAITLAWAPGKGVKGKDYKDYWEVELGVSYIPWTKLKPDIDLEMLEDGGMIDEDTMPDWLKAKQAEMQPKPPKPLLQPQVETPPKSESESAPVPTSGAQNAAVDTSQPPPMHTGGLLPPPPLIVSPFSLNTRLLGPMSMMPPGMMPNVPIGVPPPTMPGPIMPNQLLGLGSPFGMPQHMPQIPMPGLQEAKAEPPMVPPSLSVERDVDKSHEDMEIEEEEVDKSEKQMPLSDQLLASIGGRQFTETSTPSLGLAVSRFGDNILPPADVDERTTRAEMPRDSRPRDRDRDRPVRDRSMRDRERDRDRDRNTRNRWSDRRDDKKPDRNEKSLAERLREMAHDGVVSIRERASRERNDGDKIPPFEPQPQIERNVFAPSQQFPNGEPRPESERINQDVGWRGNRGEPDVFRRGGSSDDFDPRVRRHPGHSDEFIRNDRPEFDFDNRRPPLINPEERFGRGRDRREGFGRPEENRMRPDFFPPRENFGVRPMMRGPRPDNFPPRPDNFPPRPLLRPPGPHGPPHMFHPRGPMGIRGPRPGPWMENIRPNFPPRFDTPDHFNRPPFDEPHHIRPRRFDERRWYRSDHENDSNDRFDRKSRWGNTSPSKADEMKPSDLETELGLEEGPESEQPQMMSDNDKMPIEDQRGEEDMKLEEKADVGETDTATGATDASA